ncbi:MAG: hypothetical protein Fur007_21740 [Rhodoferax sp.]
MGADGRVTFADRPPAGAASAVTEARVGDATPPALEGLPYALRRVVSTYPVTLYTTAPCGPCDSARALLKQRGVVFYEKTIRSAEDAQALQQIAGASSVPVLRVGGQVVSGFQPDTWNQYLNAAGYPQENQLPRTYTPPPPSPLVAPKPAASAASAAASAPPEEAPSAAPVLRPRAPVKPANTNPAGIQF